MENSDQTAGTGHCPESSERFKSKFSDHNLQFIAINQRQLPTYARRFKSLKKSPNTVHRANCTDQKLAFKPT